MRKKRNGPRKHVAVWLLEEEWKALEKKIGQTTCRSVSEYLRKVILGEPVRVLHRSQSLDDLIQEAILLRKELQSMMASIKPEKMAQGEALWITVDKIRRCMEKMVDHVLSNKI